MGQKTLAASLGGMYMHDVFACMRMRVSRGENKESDSPFVTRVVVLVYAILIEHSIAIRLDDVN
jgi:hypothetical protein